MNIQELETAHRLGLRILMVIMNDEALTAERLKLKSSGYDPEIVMFPSADFGSIASAFGWKGSQLTEIGGLESLVADFCNEGVATLIDVRVSREVLINPVHVHDLSFAAIGR
jgi:acetolactate synthase-1/2/3 large subunit